MNVRDSACMRGCGSVQPLQLRRDGDVRRPIGVDDFELKNWVRLWFSDPGRQEYPTNVTARQVEVVDRP